MHTSPTHTGPQRRRGHLPDRGVPGRGRAGQLRGPHDQDARAERHLRADQAVRLYVCVRMYVWFGHGIIVHV